MATVTTDPSAFPQSLPSPPPRLLYRMSMEKYEAMVQSGVFTKRDRFQLVRRTPGGNHDRKSATRHRRANSVPRSLERSFPPAGMCGPIGRCGFPRARAYPSPILVVVRGEIRDYLKRHPEPVDVSLVIEVADSSLEEDRMLMARVYGGGGVARYWIVNLVDRQVEVHSQPSGTAEPLGYRHCEIFRPGQSIPVLIDETEVGRIAVAEILP